MKLLGDRGIPRPKMQASRKMPVKLSGKRTRRGPNSESKETDGQMARSDMPIFICRNLDYIRLFFCLFLDDGKMFFDFCQDNERAIKVVLGK